MQEFAVRSGMRRREASENKKENNIFAQPDRSDLTAFPLNNKLTSNS